MALAISTTAFADTYRVNVTRKSKDLYRVDNSPFWVQTKYCYTYAYGEDAALTESEIVFLDSDDQCDVKQVLKETSVPAGDYKVSATREADNWYSTFEGVFVRTNFCLSLAIGDDAVLRMNGFGGGTIIFVDDRDECDIEGLFSKIRL